MEHEQVLELIKEVNDAYDDKGSRYVKMLYAAYLSKLRIPPEYVAVMIYESPDGSQMIGFQDIRKLNYIQT